jgi:hypothetical protein
MLGCGQPAGESGFNLARVVAVLAGLDGVPGTTVNRYCSSSLQTTRMAMHAIRADNAPASNVMIMLCIDGSRACSGPCVVTLRDGRRAHWRFVARKAASS